MSTVGRRELAGGAAIAAVVAASLLTSPRATLAAAAGLADRPAVFAAILVGLWVGRPFVGWPTVAVSALAGFVLGPVAGLPVALVGVVVSSMPPFLGARWFDGGDGVLARLGRRGRSYFRAAGTVRGVAAARLAPVPADAVSVGAGLSGVGPAAYVAGTLLGELPWTVAAVVVGGSARTLTLDGLGAVGVPLLVGTTVAAGVLLAPPALRVFRRDATSGT